MTEAADPPPPPGKGPSPARLPLWLRLVLFASLALNLLVLGIVGGALLGRRDGPRDAPAAALVRDLGLGPYLMALGPEDRDALRAAVETRGDRLRAGRAEMRALFAETLAALRAEPFDPARLAAGIAAQAGAAARGQMFGQELLVERVAAMTPAERAALADRLEKALRRGGRGHDRHGADMRRDD